MERAGPKKTYSWALTDGKCQCYDSPTAAQDVIKLWEVVEARPFHDDTLMQATAQINRLLATAAKKSPDPERELCFITIEDRAMLVWSQTHRGLTADDDPMAVAQALGLISSEFE